MRRVEVTTQIETTPERVISAFTEVAMLRQWWSVEHALIDKRQGGPYILAWNISPHGFGYVSTGLIKQYDPMKELVVENYCYLNPKKPVLGPMTLTVHAKTTSGGTEAYLCQDGYQEGEHWDWYYEAVREAWPKMMVVVKDYLEKGIGNHIAY